MKHFWSNLHKKMIYSVLAAAMSLSLAASGTSLDMQSLAEGETSTEETSEEEEIAGKVKQISIDPDLGELILYRWERVDNGQMFTDDQEHMTLLFAVENNSANRYLSGSAPDYVWYGPDVGSFTGMKSSNRYSHDQLQNLDIKSDIDEDKSIYIRSRYYVGYNDNEAKPGQKVFYTSNTRDCVYIKYKGVDDKNKNAGGKDKSPKYVIRLSSDDSTKYWIGSSNSGDGYMDIATSENSAWTFKCTHNISGFGDAWHVFVERGGGDDDECLRVRSSDNLWCIENDDGSGNDLLWYNGKKERYSAFQTDKTVERGEILEVHNGDFIDASGKKEHENGVILPNGKTITVNKGGILSINGTFINNGTIINNGGTIIVKNGGTICPFKQGDTPSKNGCGKIKCVDGDIIIQQGGAVYMGISDDKGNIITAEMQGASTLINQGTLVYGNLYLGNGARVELYETAQTFGAYDRCYEHIYKGSIAYSWSGIINVTDTAGNVVAVYTRTVRPTEGLLASYNSYFQNNTPGSQNFLTQMTAGSYFGTNLDTSYKRGMYTSTGNTNYTIRYAEGCRNNFHDDLLDMNGMVTGILGL